MKNNVSLKMMKLPKIFSFKTSIFSFFLAIILLFLSAQGVLAACRLFNCIPDEGWCEEGAVMSCVEGVMKCQGGQWVPTAEAVNNRCVYSPMGGPSVLEQYEEAIQAPEINLQQWVGSDIGKTKLGTMDSIAAWGVVSILGCSTCEEGEGPTSAVQGMGNLIAGMYANPPASSVEYFADLGRNLEIVKPVYAQGVGFQGLRPILAIWKAFRNIAYLFFVIIFVIIGFAIMFRVKIDPQTVISLQNAIPRIVIALILVTFSYAIAGLVIDLIYVAIGLIAAIFGSTGLVARPEELGPQYLNANFLTAMGAIFRGGFQAFFGLVESLIGYALGGMGIAGIITAIVGVGTIPWLGAFAVGAAGFALLVVLLIAILLLYIFFKLFLTLLKAYVSIILAVIFGPLQIMLDAIPGVSGFGGWLRNLIANAAVFPAVAAMFMLAAIIGQRTGEPGWTAPFLRVGESPDMARNLIALGILLMTPQVADMVKQALQMKPTPWPIGLGPIGAIPRAAAGLAVPAAFERLIYAPGYELTWRRYLARLFETGRFVRQPETE